MAPGGRLVGQGVFAWVTATVIALIVGLGAAAAATALLGALVGPAPRGSSASAEIQLVGYLTWVTVAVIVSWLVLRRLGNR